MIDILNEIEKVCLDNPIDLKPSVFNRYMMLGKNHDNTKTAYCFSVPICNSYTNQIGDLKFHHNKSGSFCYGTSSTVSISDTIWLKNEYGSCQLSLQGKIVMKTDKTICLFTDAGFVEIRPTLNGLYFKVPCSLKKETTIQMAIDSLHDSIKSNDKYFAIMREEFVPLVTVSCVGILDGEGNVIAPCKMSCQVANEKEYTLKFKSESQWGEYIAYEVNMYEEKLFHDTTVESQNPEINNAFGGIAFIGQTEVFGEQMLYSRLDFLKILPLQNKKIVEAVLHIPKLNDGILGLIAHHIASRFCSFGTNWENKIPVAQQFSESAVFNGYYHLNITELVKSIKNKKNENFVIKANKENDKPVVISTGDSFFHPQILEIKFK